MNRKQSHGAACSAAHPIYNGSSGYKSEKRFSPVPSTVPTADFISVGFKTASGTNIKVSGASLDRIQKLNLLNDKDSSELVDSPMTENKAFSKASGFPPTKSFMSPVNKAQCDSGISDALMKTSVTKNIKGFQSTKNFVSPVNKTQFDAGSSSSLRKTIVGKNLKSSRYKGFKSPLLHNQQKSLSIPEASMKPNHYLPRNSLSSSNKKIETTNFEKARDNTSELFDADSHKLNLLNDQMLCKQIDSLLTENETFSKVSGCHLTKSLPSPVSKVQSATEISSTLQNADISQNFQDFRYKCTKSPLFRNPQKSLDVPQKCMKTSHFIPENTLNTSNKKAETNSPEFDAEAIMEESEQFFESLFLDDMLDELSSEESTCNSKHAIQANSHCTNNLNSKSIHQNLSTAGATESALVGFKTASGSGIKVSSASLDKIQKMNLLSDQSTTKFPPVQDPKKTFQFKPLQSSKVQTLSENVAPKVKENKFNHCKAGSSKETPKTAIESQSKNIWKGMNGNLHKSPIDQTGLSNVSNYSKTVQIKDDFKVESTCKETKVSDSADHAGLPNTAAVYSKSHCNSLIGQGFDFSSPELYNDYTLNNMQRIKLSSMKKLDCILQCNYFVGKKCSKPSSTSKFVSPSNPLVGSKVLNHSKLFDAKSPHSEFSRDGHSKANTSVFIPTKHLTKTNSTFLEAICGFCDIVRYNDEIEQLDLVPHSISNAINLCSSNHTGIELVNASSDCCMIEQVLGK